MSEPWMNDFRALRDHTRRDAPSAERTRELVLASAMNPETPKEKDMTLIRRRPVLALAIAIALALIITPVAYAVVNKVFLEVDPEQSEEQIERSVTEQLEAAGVSPSAVRAEKSDDGSLKIGIHTEGTEADVPEFDVAVRGGAGTTGEEHRNQVRIEVQCDLAPEQMQALTALVSGEEFISQVHERDDGQTDDQVAASLRAMLAKHGFKSATVSVSGSDISVTVTAPPT